MAAEFDQPPVHFDESTAQCASAAVVDLFGPEALSAAGITPDEFATANGLPSLGLQLPDDAVTRLPDEFERCDVADALTSVLVEGFRMEGVELSPEMVTCVESHVDERAVVGGLARNMLGNPDGDIQPPLMDAYFACPSAVAALLMTMVYVPVTPAIEACVANFAVSQLERLRETYEDGDWSADEGIGADFGSACPEAVGAPS